MRDGSRVWYAGIFGGLLPVLLLGFGYSALADRFAFALWALALAVVWTAALRAGLQEGWSRGRLAAALALVLAAGLAAFAGLELKHREILDLGFRAVLPGLHHPSATHPGTAAALAAVLGLGGGAAWALFRKREMKRELR